MSDKFESEKYNFTGPVYPNGWPRTVDWEPWDGKDDSKVHQGMLRIGKTYKITHFGLWDKYPAMGMKWPIETPLRNETVFNPPLELKPGIYRVIRRTEDGPLEIWRGDLKTRVWPRGERP